MNDHPRLLLGPADLPTLRRRIGRGLGRRIAEAIRRRVGPQVRRLLRAKSVDPLQQRGRRGWGFNTPLVDLHDIALLGVLDNNDAYIEAARRVLNAIPAADRDGAVSRYLEGYDLAGTPAMAFDLIHDRLQTEERQRFIEYALDAGILRPLETLRGSFLRGAGANTPLMKVVTALTLLRAIDGEPGVPDLRARRAEILNYWEAAVHCAIGPQGYPEEDMGYGTMVVAKLALVGDILRRAGWLDPDTACPELARAGRAMLHMTQPWGEHQVNTGDRITAFPWREWFLSQSARRQRAPSLLWLLGRYRNHGIDGSADAPGAEIDVGGGMRLPATGLSLIAVGDTFKPLQPRTPRVPTSFQDERRGIVSFRDSWSEDATFVVFDGSQRSPAAPGHSHASGGHFNLTALGDYFAIDTGRYAMEQADHNLVLVDGRSAHPIGRWEQARHHGRLTGFRPGEFCDLASADSSAQHDCRWARRSLVLVKGGRRDVPAYVWIVEDVNKADDYREFWWTLNTSPGNRIALRRDGACITGWRRGNQLDIHLVLPDPREYPKPHTLALAQDTAITSAMDPAEARRLAGRLGRSAIQSGTVPVRPRFTAKVAGYNGRFMSVLLPRRHGAAPARVERLATVGNSLAVRVTFGLVEDILIWAYDHGRLEAGDIRARGDWCVVRRSRATGRVLAHDIGKGLSLKIAGRELL